MIYAGDWWETLGGKRILFAAPDDPQCRCSLKSACRTEGLDR